jgi:magnesium chelatase family protein
LNTGALNYSEVKGQDFAKRAMEIAAAGSHNLLMIGPPGSGKSMLAKRFSTILPPMDLEEALVASKIHSVMGLLPKSGELLQQRPFRSPHHSVSDIGLVGGGRIPQPGEISLAHQGVLFLDELPEFQRSVLEVLRQPLEDDQVTISRAAGSTCFPAQFILLAAMNPCPCGFLTDETKSCHCTASQIHKYRAKISGPLLDRIDLHIEVPAIRYDDIASTEYAESSEIIAERVLRVRDLQRDRFSDSFKKVNGRMSDADMKRFCACLEGTESLLRSIIDEMGFSARAYGKILKVSRTIADMAGADRIREEHILEAVQYRSLDRDILSDVLV